MLYLDQAATSFPKPSPVLAAVEHWFRELGVSPGRGDSQRTTAVHTIVQQARAGIGALVGMPPERVAFTSGCTESINLFLRGFLRRGDRVLTTAFEHSSLVRPLLALQGERELQVDVLPPDLLLPEGLPAEGLPPEGRHGLAVAAVRSALAAKRPRLFAFTHASNVTGAAFDAAAFCAAARAQGCTTLLDASQTAGHLDLRVGADAVAASAHKALLAPPGLGFLAVRAEVPLEGQKQGGTGSSRALDVHPREWPTAFEAGTPNTPAICGLHAALRWRQTRPPGDLLQRALQRVEELQGLLLADPRFRVFAPPPGPRTPVLSFAHGRLDPGEIGALLDAADVHVRTGHHCAPWLHRHLGTETAGTVRVSPGPEVTAADIRSVWAVLAR
jgi:selenocysteine lyase/cysteine desulfurase